MKIFKVIILSILLIVFIESYGKNIKRDNMAQEIKVLIQKIKSAPPEEKYKYVNELKKIIRNLNEKDRKQLIKKLLEKQKKNKQIQEKSIQSGQQHPEKYLKQDNHNQQHLINEEGKKMHR